MVGSRSNGKGLGDILNCHFFFSTNIPISEAAMFFYSCQTFPGNENQCIVVGHSLKEPVTTRYVRIHPKSWQGSISMRAELYGCSGGDGLSKTMRYVIIVTLLRFDHIVQRTTSCPVWEIISQLHA